VDGLELALQPAGAIEVSLHVPGGGKLGTGASTVGLRSIGSNSAIIRWADKGKDALRLADLAPGSYWLLTRTEEGVCITSARLNGREALHGKVTVTAGRRHTSMSLFPGTAPAWTAPCCRLGSRFPGRALCFY
jgi:hypothetical protein